MPSLYVEDKATGTPVPRLLSMCRGVRKGKGRSFLAHLNPIPEIQPGDMEQDRCLVPTVAEVMDVSGVRGQVGVCVWDIKKSVTLERSR